MPPCASAVHTMSGMFSRRERSEEHTSELQSQSNLVCRLLLEKKNKTLAQPGLTCAPPDHRHSPFSRMTYAPRAPQPVPTQQTPGRFGFARNFLGSPSHFTVVC